MSVKVFINQVEQTVLQWKFPTGEVGVQLLNPMKVAPTDYAVVNLMFSGNDDIFYALNLLDALENIGFKKQQLILDIPYLPYSRQDRICNPGESFASKVLLDILFNSAVLVRTHDMHSDAYTIPNLMNVKQHVCVGSVSKFDLLIGPDKGSTNKIKDVAFCNDRPYIVLDKKRTTKGITTEIQEQDRKLVNFVKSAIVIDDLLDGGMTFIKTAQAIKEVNPDIKLSLYITHGFFTAGIDKLKESYDNIYCKFLYNTDPAVKAFVKEI